VSRAATRPPTLDFYEGGAPLTIGAHKGSVLTHGLACGRFRRGAARLDDTVLRNNMLSIFIAPAVYDGEGTVLAKRSASSIREGVAADDTGQPVSVPATSSGVRAPRDLHGVPLTTRRGAISEAAQSVVSMRRAPRRVDKVT
jgi:hypothetical protein